MIPSPSKREVPFLEHTMNNRLGYLPLEAIVDAGIMCCSPEGAGFECAFDEIRLKQ